MTKPTMFIGKDSHEVPRVWAEHASADIAETMCREEALAYVRRRPDTGPLSLWQFESEVQTDDRR